MKGKIRYCNGIIFCIIIFSTASHAYKLIGAEWDISIGPVEFSIHENGSDDVHDGTDIIAIRNAFNTWSCIEKSGLRTKESTRPANLVFDLSDNNNSLFWVEEKEVSLTFGMGPSTLGITIGTAPTLPGEMVIRDSADIAFNGAYHTWSTDDDVSATDIESIALHEIGHFFGLDHPCSDATEEDCLGHSQSVMTPIYEGGSLRILGADDIKGMLKIYEVDDGSSCSGPYRQGEPCSHNCNCVTNLKCISIDDGPNLCTATCNGENAECPGNLPCVLGATPLNGGFPKGICIPNIFDGLYPEASICGADTQCKSGLCSPNDVFGRSACIKNCEVHVDCENGFSCHENICVAREIIVGTDCPQTENFEEAQCGCSSLNNYPSRNGIFFLIGILLIIKFIIRQKFQT